MLMYQELLHSSISEEREWPENNFQSNLGQVAGLALDSDDKLYVFHRAGNVWDFR